MKKKIKVIPICILLISVFCLGFFINKANHEFVKAEEVEHFGDCDNLDGTAPGSCYVDGDKKYDDENYVKITEGGDITVNYIHGISEILIRARKCTVDDETTPRTVSCDKGKNVYIFSSGEKKTNTKVIHLSNYFAKGEYVLVEMVYAFWNGIEGNGSNFNDKPLYCNITPGNPLVASGGPCKGFSADNPNKFSVYARVKAIDTNYLDAEVKLLDNNHLVYSVDWEVDSGGGTPIAGNGSVLDFYPPENAYVYTLVKIDNREAQKSASEGVENVIYDTVVPVLLTILGIAATVTVVVLGYQIIKSSDEPQERSEKIHRLRSILLGLVMAFVLLAALEPIVKFVEGWLE